MKKHLFIIVFGILCTSCSTNNEKETRNLDKFEKVNIIGHVELHLESSPGYSMEVMTTNTADLASLVTEVRDGELYIYSKKECAICPSPKYRIDLSHSGISDVTLTGKIKLNSDDEISQKDLAIRGNGILNGNLAVAVNNLSVDLNGITNIHISGHADTADLKVRGIGIINAGSLNAKSSNKVSHGIAIINK